MKTKEKILIVAVELFAKYGFDAVSTSMIAKRLGMTKSALYRHYQTKREIMNGILEKVHEINREEIEKHESFVAENLGNHEEPEKDFVEESEKDFVEDVKKSALEQFDFWTKNSFVAAFRKMLTIEQYKDEKLGNLYREYFLVEPIELLEDTFSEMIEKGILKDVEPRVLAIQFYGPIYLGMQTEGQDFSLARTKVLLEKHVDVFFKEYALL